MVAENITLCILTVEIYGRNFCVDAHAENAPINFPEPLEVDDRYYQFLKITLSTMSQGKQRMKKLIIGATTVNILVTCTIP